MLALALMMAAWPSAARAQATARPPDAAPADTTVGLPRVAAADTLARGRPARRSFFRRPTGIMLRSLVVPGWGQATNGKWLKAGLVAGGEAALIVSILRDTDRLNGLDPADPAYAETFDRRQRQAWWLGGLVFLSMVDAYVDAHLKGFDVELGPEPSDRELRVSARIGFP